MRTRSITFRLVGWYAGLLLVIASAFGAYGYQRLEGYLSSALLQSLASRATRISETLVKHIDRTGEPFVAAEVKARYAPEQNDRFIRITRADGSQLYCSNPPSDKSFDPEEVPRFSGAAPALKTREEKTANGTRLLIAGEACTSGTQGYVVEVGASRQPILKVLNSFLVTLFSGMPLVVGGGILGGYFLIKRALAPVQTMMRAAQEISIHHWDQRLPEIRTGDEIEQLSQSLNQMLTRLNESYQTSTRFAADASHELRTPLTIMRGELEAMLERKNVPLELQEDIGSLLEEAEHLTRIVEGLLALSRLDAGGAQHQRKRLDFSELVSTTLDQIALLGEEKQIALTCKVEHNVEVEGDPVRLKQMVLNLVDNALKYTPPGGEVHVTVNSSDRRAVLLVEDTGIGIAKEDLAHIFNRFYRSKAARASGAEGVGLGLSIVQSVCNAHGGMLTAENKSPRGCRFTTSLPLASKSNKPMSLQQAPSSC